MSTNETTGAGEASGEPKKSWRDRLGLRQAAPDPDEWVPVSSAHVDNAETGFSKGAARVVQVLEDAGRETEQRPYVLPDHTGYHALNPAGVNERIGVAVLVRQRDLDAARVGLGQLQQEIQRHKAERQQQLAGAPDSDAELTRLSLEASEELKEQAGAED